jgi:hypothetical protein
MQLFFNLQKMDEAVDSQWESLLLFLHVLCYFPLLRQRIKLQFILQRAKFQ